MSKLLSKNAKRNGKGQFIHGHSSVFIASFWLAGIASLGLLWLAGRAVMSDLGSFRNCNGGTGILSVSSCGKQSLNPGDFILLGLFVLAACFSLSLLTGAWRATRKGTVIA
jgi:hypothetical protein